MKLKEMMKKLKVILNPRERKLAVFILVLSLITGLAQSASIVLILPFINVVFNPALIQENEILKFVYDLFQLQRTLTFLIVLGSLIFIAVIGSNILMVITIYAKTRFVTMRNHYLSKKLLNKYLASPYIFFLNRNSSELTKRVLDEVNQFTSGFLMALMEVIIYGVTLITIIATILIIDFFASLTAIIVFGLLYGLLIYRLKGTLKRKGKEAIESNRLRYLYTTEALASIKTTKILGKESYFLERYSDASFNFARNNTYKKILAALPRYVIEGIAFGGLMLFIVIQLALGRNLDSLIPIVGVLGLAGYRMLPALNQAFSALSNVIFLMPIVDKIYDEMTEKGEFASLMPSINLKPLPFNQGIHLNKVTFSYDAQQSFKINNIELSIKKNQVVGFIGETGSGKSTLIDIMMGLLKPEEGSISVDGTIILNENVRAYQRLIGYVPQDIYLSDDTLEKNIAFGVKAEDIDKNQIKKAAQIAAIDQFIESELEEGYQTFVGERGVRLSGGQRQRVGIARALYHNPEIIVFDEATSALDNQTEKEVLKAIKNASKDRTVIMIAHRLNTLKDCDVIYKLEKGEIVFSGSYQDVTK
jgi:ABC-type bacteriocin/lantibiotic exporter with double-glycine peptidase domain